MELFQINKILITLLLLGTVTVYSQISGKIIGIKDGDTVVILLEENIQKTLRLAEVDCPESGQPFGKNAKQFTSKEVFGKVVDYWETDVDRYGRSIAKIFYDNGKYLSAELIKEGFGWWYYMYSSDRRLQKLEQSARSAQLGLWSDPYAIAPWEFRKLNR